jgi:nicotinamide-nucleotide amidase
MSDRLRASIVVIGDEILSGYVADTNSGWLAERLQAIGVPLDRVQTVPDDLDAIGEAIGTELARSRPRLVLTSGGIGSTPDDVTLAAVARHLGRDLVVESAIDSHITRALAWSAEQGVAASPDHERLMRKMALLPEGASLLPGTGGITPGVALAVDGGLDEPNGATIVVLPGVPAQLRRIMTDGIEPALLAGRGEPDHVLEVHHPYPESILSPVLERIVLAHPQVHVGSYPGTECTVRLKGPKAEVVEAMALVEDALAELAADPAAARLSAAWQARWSS